MTSKSNNHVLIYHNQVCLFKLQFCLLGRMLFKVPSNLYGIHFNLIVFCSFMFPYEVVLSLIGSGFASTHGHTW